MCGVSPCHASGQPSHLLSQPHNVRTDARSNVHVIDVIGAVVPPALRRRRSVLIVMVARRHGPCCLVLVSDRLRPDTRSFFFESVKMIKMKHLFQTRHFSLLNYKIRNLDFLLSRPPGGCLELVDVHVCKPWDCLLRAARNSARRHRTKARFHLITKVRACEPLRDVMRVHVCSPAAVKRHVTDRMPSLPHPQRPETRHP